VRVSVLACVVVVVVVVVAVVVVVVVVVDDFERDSQNSMLVPHFPGSPKLCTFI